VVCEIQQERYHDMYPDETVAYHICGRVRAAEFFGIQDNTYHGMPWRPNWAGRMPQSARQYAVPPLGNFLLQLNPHSNEK
jgi:hypothetical protein